MKNQNSLIMKRIIPLIVLFMTVSVLQSQNAKEAIQNTKQVMEGKKNLERDSKELAAFTAKVESFYKVFDARNTEKSNELKLSIIQDMVREVQQTGVKAKKARREITQSTTEIISDRKEIEDNKKDSRRTRYDRRDDKRDQARDKANLRDDKRDRRDDIKDLKMQITRAERQAAILKALKAYNFSYGKGDLEKASINKKLIEEFKETMKADIIDTKRELEEDMREAKEDRRERRDDKNEDNETDRKKRRRIRN